MSYEWKKLYYRQFRLEFRSDAKLGPLQGDASRAARDKMAGIS